MSSSSLTPEEFMHYWQSAFGDLDPKWHKQFLESEYISKILEFSRDEIREYLRNPPIVVEYVGIYHIRQERYAKLLREIWEYLRDPNNAIERAPLGTYTKKIEATGTDFATESWSALWKLGEINQTNGRNRS